MEREMINETIEEKTYRLLKWIYGAQPSFKSIKITNDFKLRCAMIEMAIAEEREAKKRGERVKAFKIMVTKCANAEKRIKECPHADSNGYSHDFCGIAKMDGRTEYNVYRDNEDGLTPSCPMWSETVEVSE